MTYDPEVLDRAIRQQQAMLEIKILSFLRGPGDHFPCKRPIFRVSSLHNQIQIRYRAQFTSKNSECLQRPVNVAAGNIPAETPGLAQSLGFGQVSLASLKCLFGPLA